MDELSGEHELPTEQAASATPPTSCHEPGRSEQFPAVRSLRVGGDHRLPLPAREWGIDSPRAGSASPREPAVQAREDHSVQRSGNHASADRSPDTSLGATSPAASFAVRGCRMVVAILGQGTIARGSARM
jgi:hypothetical protein